MKNRYLYLLLLALSVITSCDTTEPTNEINYHNKILFTSSRSGKAQLYMMNPDGTDVRQITSGQYSHSGGRWSPDTKQIIAQTDENWNTAYYTQMVIMNSDGTNRNLLGYGSQMSWSPNMKKIAFVRLPHAELGDLSRFIYIMVVQENKYIQITKYEGLIVGNPSFSNDGKFIYFSSNQHDPLNNNPEIYRMNSDGSNITRITFTPNGYSTSPSISPDGTMIAFVSKRTNLSVPAIFVMNIDKTGLKKIVQPPSGEVFNFPRWSPDASMLIFVAGLTDGTTRTFIYKVNIDGTNFKKINLDDDTVSLPDWSK